MKKFELCFLFDSCSFTVLVLVALDFGCFSYLGFVEFWLMETKFGGKVHFYGPVVSDVKAVGKKSLEWDLNDWKWDGDLFTASPLNPVPSDCRSRQLFPLGPQVPANGGLSNSSSSCSEDNIVANEKGSRELEKRRRAVVVEDEELNNNGSGPLNLKLGGQVYPIMDGEVKSGKKTKIVGTT